MNGVRIHRRTSQDIAPMTKRRCGGGRPTATDLPDRAMAR